jgi:hypothetical protein
MKVFKEEQRFTQTWVVILLVISGLIPVLIIFMSYLKNKEEQDLSNIFVTISITMLVSAVIFLFKLTTRIDQEGIHYQFFPFHLKLRSIAWNEIKTAYVRNYDAITEYGGWGLKGGFFWKKSKGVAINVSGDIGIQLTLKNGKKILIGTQLKEQANQVLETYFSKTKNHEN